MPSGEHPEEFVALRRTSIPHCLGFQLLAAPVKSCSLGIPGGRLRKEVNQQSYHLHKVRVKMDLEGTVCGLRFGPGLSIGRGLNIGPWLLVVWIFGRVVWRCVGGMGRWFRVWAPPRASPILPQRSRASQNLPSTQLLSCVRIQFYHSARVEACAKVQC